MLSFTKRTLVFVTLLPLLTSLSLRGIRGRDKLLTTAQGIFLEAGVKMMPRSGNRMMLWTACQAKEENVPLCRKTV